MQHVWEGESYQVEKALLRKEDQFQFERIWVRSFLHNLLGVKLKLNILNYEKQMPLRQYSFVLNTELKAKLSFWNSFYES